MNVSIPMDSNLYSLFSFTRKSFSVKNLKNESIDNSEFIGTLTKKIIQIERSIKDLILNGKGDNDLLKRLQSVILSITEDLPLAIEENSDELMKDFLHKTNDLFVKLNTDLVDEMMKRFNDSFNDDIHDELTSKHKSLIAVYEND